MQLEAYLVRGHVYQQGEFFGDETYGMEQWKK